MSVPAFVKAYQVLPAALAVRPVGLKVAVPAVGVATLVAFAILAAS